MPGRAGATTRSAPAAGFHASLARPVATACRPRTIAAPALGSGRPVHALTFVPLAPSGIAGDLAVRALPRPRLPGALASLARARPRLARAPTCCIGPAISATSLREHRARSGPKHSSMHGRRWRSDAGGSSLPRRRLWSPIHTSPRCTRIARALLHREHRPMDLAPAQDRSRLCMRQRLAPVARRRPRTHQLRARTGPPATSRREHLTRSPPLADIAARPACPLTLPWDVASRTPQPLTTALPLDSRAPASASGRHAVRLAAAHFEPASRRRMACCTSSGSPRRASSGNMRSSSTGSSGNTSSGSRPAIRSSGL